MVRGHPSPRFLLLDAFGVSISRHTEWGGGVIGPRDNVFPGPAVALDGPGVSGLASQEVMPVIQQTRRKQSIELLNVISNYIIRREINSKKTYSFCSCSDALNVHHSSTSQHACVCIGKLTVCEKGLVNFGPQIHRVSPYNFRASGNILIKHRNIVLKLRLNSVLQ